MKRIIGLKTLFVTNAAFAFIGGLGELLAPQQLVGSFVPSLDASGVFIAQHLGLFQLGTAVISLLARNIQDKVALKAIVAGFVVIQAGIPLLSLRAMSEGLMSSEGIVDVVIHGLLALGFGYVLLRKERPSQSRTSA